MLREILTVIGTMVVLFIFIIACAFAYTRTVPDIAEMNVDNHCKAITRTEDDWGDCVVKLGDDPTSLNYP